MTRAEQQARKAQQERMRQVERRHKEAARGQMDLPFRSEEHTSELQSQR